MKPGSLLPLLAVSAALLAPFAVQAEDRTLVRLATVPSGAEVTGLAGNDRGELFLNAQHPGGKNTFRDDAPPALVGYVHGFDAGFVGPGLPLPADGSRADVAVAAGEYVVFGRAGDALGSGQVLGGVYDISGALMYVSNAPDFNGFVPLGKDRAYLYTGWEGAGRNGASAVSRLSLMLKDGRWQADPAASRMIDLSPVHGGAVLCSGVVTPWGTPLLAEEYFYYGTAVWNHPGNHDDDETPPWKEGATDITYIKPKNMAQYLGRMANPYRYGYMIEIRNPGAEGEPDLVKHYATGRLSHETAAIMPDNRTLYMSDDDSAVYSHETYNTASGGVLFKFVADVPGDLSAGTLFAAKLTQDATDDPHKAGFDVTWIELGHASNAEIEAWVAEYDAVKVSDYVDGQTNYVSDDDIRAWAEAKSGTDLDGDGTVAQATDARAAFLESRRTAAAMGATNEWDKLEGVTTQGNAVYVSASALAYTMDKGWGVKDWSSGQIDAAQGGHVALTAEGCGGTYVAITGSDWNITRLDPYVIGRTAADGSCEPDVPANPDNILALPNGVLLIGEDAGPKKHVLDMLWLVK